MFLFGGIGGVMSDVGKLCQRRPRPHSFRFILFLNCIIGRTGERRSHDLRSLERGFERDRRSYESYAEHSPKAYGNDRAVRISFLSLAFEKRAKRGSDLEGDGDRALSSTCGVVWLVFEPFPIFEMIMAAFVFVRRFISFKSKVSNVRYKRVCGEPERKMCIVASPFDT